MSPNKLAMLLSMLLVIHAAASAIAATAASVPAVLLASPGNQIDKLSAAGVAAQKVGANRLAEALHAAVSRYLLVVTVDEGLSMGDFARYGYGDATWSDSPFANVAALSAKLAGRYLLVSEAGELIDDLRRLKWSGGPAVEIGDDAEALSHLVAEGSGARLLAARAVDVAGADRLLGRACGLMQSRGLPFIAVFTAAKPSAAAAPAAAAVNRHLLAAADPTPDPKNNGTFISCQDAILLYYSNLLVRLVSAGVQKFAVNVSRVADGSALVDTTRSQCNVPGSNRTLVLKYASPTVILPTPLASLELTIQLLTDAHQFWSVGSASISMTCADGTSSNCTSVTSAPISVDTLTGLSSPNGTCYHCSPGTVLKAVSNSTLSLEFTKFQFQPFGVNKGVFSDKINDCVGFFSVEVWFSLLVLVVIIVILMYGVLMLVSVATPDRFDDPKGKTIQVNVQEGN